MEPRARLARHVTPMLPSPTSVRLAPPQTPAPAPVTPDITGLAPHAQAARHVTPMLQRPALVLLAPPQTLSPASATRHIMDRGQTVQGAPSAHSVRKTQQFAHSARTSIKTQHT